MDLNKLISRVKKFDFERELLKVVSDNQEIALDLNTDSQLGEKGIDSKGSLLPGPYAPFTIDSKQGKSGFGGITSHITLYDTGDFHDSFFMNTSKFPIVIDATDSKRNELVSEWGDDIFGLTDDSQAEFNREILSDVQNAVKKGIGIL